jgi:hypothetical protein
MKFRKHIILYLSALLFVAGCASTKVSDRDELVTGEIPRPDTIWVYDFAATPDDVPGESALAGQDIKHSTPQTAEQIATGRKVGAEISMQLVEQVNAMGMFAQRATPETKPKINDIVIHGYLLSVVQGNEKKRIAIGFGSGESELKVAVEGFEVTAHGMRKLGSGDTDSTGAKTPGVGFGALTTIITHNPLGLIVSAGMHTYGEETGNSKIEGRAKQTAKEIADILKKRFQEQGWI